MSAKPNPQANVNIGTAENAAGSEQSDINSALNPQGSPLYQSLLNTGLTNTSNQYQNAQSNARANANAAGFGGSPDITGAAQEGAELAESNALAKVPNEAAQQTYGEEMGAAGQEGQMAGQWLGAGTQLQNTAEQEQGNLWGNLLRLPQTAVSSYFGS